MSLSMYNEVSLFHLYIAFLTITASSSYNKNNDYDFLAVDFAKSNYCAKSNWFRENQYVIRTFSNVLTFFFNIVELKIIILF